MSLEHSPAREGASTAALLSGPDAPIDPLEGRLAVKPKLACKALDVGLTRLYELVNTGQLESYHDGVSRKITTASIRAYIARLLAAARAAKAALRADAATASGAEAAAAIPQVAAAASAEARTAPEIGPRPEAA